MTELLQTVRRLLGAPGFTLTAVVTLAVGIGATTAIFSVVNGILIKPLPFHESDRLVSLIHRADQQGGGALPASTAIYLTYRDHHATFESLALWAGGSVSVTGAGDPEEVQVLRTTFEFLPTLRVAPALGRAFAEADDQPGSEGTVILSHEYWLRRFGGSASAVGETLTVDGAPHVVIGVLPRNFRFLRQGASMLVPIRPDPATALVGPLAENGIARLRDGVTMAEANADVDRMIPILMESFPPVPGMDMQLFRNLRLRADLEPLKETFVGDLANVLWVLMGTIGMLLAIACANVANLHLVRTEARGHELTIRAALGASQGRIARGLLAESMLLGLAGGALGVLLAYVGLPVLLTSAAEELPRVLEVTMDHTVLAFALLVSLATGLVFGLIPASKHAGLQVASMLNMAGRAHSASRERRRAQHVLIVAQVAFALVLLVASGLMIRTFLSLQNVDAGFVAPEQVQTVRISVPETVVPEFPRVVRTFNDIQDRIGTMAGTVAAGFASQLPLSGQRSSSGFFVEDSSLAEDIAPPTSQFRYTSPGFFETLGTPLIAGRLFEWADHHEARPVVVVSESFARREWGSATNALGKRLRMTLAQPWQEVVGVVGDIHHVGLDRPADAAVYMTLGDMFAQFMSRTVSFVVRSERIGTAGFLEDLHRAVWSVDPSLPLGSVQTLGVLYDRSMARTALTLVLLGISGGMALALGLVGIHGVIAYMLAQRTREIGIRIALGARDGRIKRLIVGHVLLIVLVGTALGLAGAIVLARLMESLLFGVNALDPATYVTVAAAFVATAAIAGYLPVRRVTRIDPVRALRAE